MSYDFKPCLRVSVVKPLSPLCHVERVGTARLSDFTSSRFKASDGYCPNLFTYSSDWMKALTISAAM